MTRILAGTSDRNIRFVDLCRLLGSLGFGERVRGDHHIFTHSNVAEIINLQPRAAGMSKPYQVRQVREIIVKYKLAKESDDE